MCLLDCHWISWLVLSIVGFLGLFWPLFLNDIHFSYVVFFSVKSSRLCSLLQCHFIRFMSHFLGGFSLTCDYYPVTYINICVYTNCLSRSGWHLLHYCINRHYGLADSPKSKRDRWESPLTEIHHEVGDILSSPDSPLCFPRSQFSPFSYQLVPSKVNPLRSASVNSQKSVQRYNSKLQEVQVKLWYRYMMNSSLIPDDSDCYDKISSHRYWN